MHVMPRYAVFVLKAGVLFFLTFVILSGPAVYVAAYIGEATGWFRIEDFLCMNC
jgi:hypothetical protein